MANQIPKPAQNEKKQLDDESLGPLRVALRFRSRAHRITPASGKRAKVPSRAHLTMYTLPARDRSNFAGLARTSKLDETGHRDRSFVALSLLPDDVLVPLDPVLDGTPHEHLLLLGQPVRPDAPVEGRPGGRPEGRREVLPIAVDAADVEVEDVVAVARRLDALRVPQVVGAARLNGETRESSLRDAPGAGS